MKTEKTEWWTYVGQLTLLSVLVGTAGSSLYASALPVGATRNDYLFIPFYFYAVSLGVRGVMVYSRKHASEHRLLQISLLMSIVRMMLAVFVMVVYGMLMRHEAKHFLLAFVVHYLIYLAYDSWFSCRINRLMKKNGNEKETDI